MNANQANSIELSVLLAKLGFHPVRTQGQESWYLSPLRHERMASFHIHLKKNIWNDFGAGKGGKVVDFVCTYLQSCGEDYTVADALRWLNNMMAIQDKIVRPVRESFQEANPNLILRSIKPIQKKTLINYLARRGISLSMAKKYLKEAHVFNKKSGKKFYTLAFRNEDNGYEIRNEGFKGCFPPKTITFIRGTNRLTKEINVFEGFMDFLSALISFKKEELKGDTIVLNSLTSASKALPYINNYGYKNLYTWLDNDAEGQKFTLIFDAFAKKQEALNHKPMNAIYAPHKDVNNWHMHKLGLQKLND